MFVRTRSLEYFFVNNLNGGNSDLVTSSSHANIRITIVSTKYSVAGFSFVSKWSIKKTCTDFITDESNTIAEYLFILKRLKSTEVPITINEAISAITNVTIFTLSDAINANQKMIGNIGNNIANGCNTDTFSLAYAVRLR
ncbi:hypothetical protein A9Q91_03290 [Candidatus Gracilibacteria bacterium 28_42_T64]|nr:hypothetical protein A9Q91_03290 [Candidatus Gracilibacteria bacterium 28_42_T64]